MNIRTPIETSSGSDSGNPVAVPQTSERTMKLAAICIFLVAAVLIVTAASGDLWLDEVISLSFAESASSAWEIVSGFRHDNNHLLNTLYLYWIGRQKLLVIYRLLAILAGIGSIVLVGALAQKWGQIERLFSLLLAGTSYPLVLYFSEARGYSPAIFFALLSLAILLYRRHHMNLLRLAAFWLSLCLGLLAHSTFVIVLIALGATVLVDSCRRNPNLKFCSLMMARFFLVPVLFSAGFYVFFVRNMHIEGGPVFNKWEVICRAAALALGFSEWGLFPTAALLVVIVAMVVGTVLLYQDGSFLWVFFPTVLLAAPFLVVAATRPTYLYFRYFLICTPFLYLLLGYLLGRWYRSAFLVSRLLVVALLVAFVFSQALRLAPLLQSGRGSYRAAVRYLEANTDGNEIRVGSDHDFRNQVLLSFYARFLSPGVRLAYIEQPGWKTDRPEWIITHSQNPAFTPPDRLELRGIGHYRLTKEFRFAAISGWHWFLFHKEADR